ncbi:class I SAM-dependent methyltransferase [Kitasatospora sp. NPDC057692]|uniref:class I SAM-dependent methyltransferase n=1 Tax=Kitasatospora sp. NPDC057692 TaxID=3346215 RepID=UPI0036BB9CC8
MNSSPIPTPSPTIGDAFGQVLLRCWSRDGRSGTAFEAVEREDGFIGISDAARYFAPQDAWEPMEREACQRANGRVLDVGCGAGRHALALMSRGRQVVGIDASPGAVSVSRDRGVDAREGTAAAPGPDLGFFDTILLCGQNFGLLESRTTARQVLSALAAVASPGASLIGTGVDHTRLTSPVHADYYGSNAARGRMPGQSRIRVRSGPLSTHWFDYLFLSPGELSSLVAGSGWTLSAVRSDGADYLAHLRLG